MKIVDEVGVKISPDDKDFAAKLRAKLAADLEKATRGLRKDITVRVKTDVDQAGARLADALRDTAAAEKELAAAETTLNKVRGESVKLNGQLDQAQERHLGIIERLDLATRQEGRALDDLREVAGEYEAQARKVVTEEQRLTEARRTGLLTATQLDYREQQLDRERDKGWEIASRLEKAEDVLSRARIAVHNANQAALGSEQRGFDLREKAVTAARAYHDAEVGLEVAQKRSADAAQRSAQQTRVLEAEVAKATRTVESHRSAFGRLTTAIGRQILAQADVAASIRIVRTAMANTSAEFDKIGKSSGRLESGLRRAALGARSVVDGFRSARNAVRSFGNDSFTAGSRFERGFSRVRSVARGIVTDVRTLGSAVTSALGTAVKAATSFTDNLLDMAGGMKGVASAGASMILQIAQMSFQVTGLIAVGEALTYVLGAVGAGILAVPGLALGAAASLGVFALGMDGIKKAYNTGLKPALDKLKSQVSEVFERTLTPAFKKLGTDLIPQITDGMKKLAEAFGEGGQKIADLVTKAENVKKINQILSSMTDVVRGQLIPSLSNLIQAFLNVGSNASILRDIGGIFSDLTNKVADFLNEMNRTGEAERAVSQLRGVLASLEDVFLSALRGATRFFTEASPGMTKLFDSIKRGIDKINFDKLGADFGRVAAAAGRLIDSIPQSSIDAIVAAMGRLADKLVEIADDPGFQQFVQKMIDIIPELIDNVNGLFDAFNKIRGALQAVDDFFKPLTDVMNQLSGQSDTTADSLGKVPPPLDATADAAKRAGDGIQAGLVPPLQILPDKANTSFSGVADAANKLQPLPGTAAAAAAAAAAGVANNLAPMPGQADAAFGGVNAAGDKLQPLPGTAAALAAGTQQGVTSNLDPLPGQAGAALSGVTAAVGANLADARGAAQVGGQQVADAVQQPLSQVPAQTGQALSGVPAAVQGPLDQARGTADAGARGISDAVRNGLNSAADGARDAMGRVATSVADGTNRAAASATDGGNRIRTALDQAGQGAASAMQGSMDRVAAAVQSGIDRAAVAAQNGADRIRTAMEQAGQQVEQRQTATWNRVADIVRSGCDRAVSSAQSGAQRIVAAFRSQEGAMYSAGVALIERLTAGMIAQGAAATAAAARIAASIKAQFPSSPAKEGPLSGRGDPLLSGGTIVSRLADGMRRDGPLRASLDAVTGQVRSALASVDPAGQLAATTARATSGAVIATARDLTARVPATSGPAAAGPASAGQDAAALLAELQSQTAQLRALARALTGDSSGADAVDRLDALVAAVGGPERAAEKTRRLRETGALGAFA